MPRAFYSFCMHRKINEKKRNNRNITHTHTTYRTHSSILVCLSLISLLQATFAFVSVYWLLASAFCSLLYAIAYYIRELRLSVFFFFFFFITLCSVLFCRFVFILFFSSFPFRTFLILFGSCSSASYRHCVCAFLVYGDCERAISFPTLSAM